MSIQPRHNNYKPRHNNYKRVHRHAHLIHVQVHYCGYAHEEGKCSWWHPRQANDAVASEPRIFSENHDYKVFPVSGEHVRTYISGSR